MDNAKNLVLADYKEKVEKNKENYLNGDSNATQEYTFPNQINDAENIIKLFYENPEMRAISIIKRTKVGMDGLMIEIAKQITTHDDPLFRINYKNVLFLTGMSNIAWETDMKNNIPKCFKDNVIHRGKLNKKRNVKKFEKFNNGLIIIDEVDTGDDINHMLAKTLHKHDLMSIDSVYSKNLRFIFVSATMKKQISELIKWDEKIHKIYNMTIPDTYVTHNDLLQNGIIQEFYEINDNLTAEKWIKEDIIDNYITDYRVHIIRVSDKNMEFIINAAKLFGIKCLLHTCMNRIEPQQLDFIFNNLDNHVIIMIKGFYRRANLIPNNWKVKIGAIHELYTSRVDVNVQIQGLSGRMTGYWKHIVLNTDLKFGPYRTSITSIQEYEKWFRDPINYNSKKYITNNHKSTYLKKTHFY